MGGRFQSLRGSGRGIHHVRRLPGGKKRPRQHPGVLANAHLGPQKRRQQQKKKDERKQKRGDGIGWSVIRQGLRTGYNNDGGQPRAQESGVKANVCLYQPLVRDNLGEKKKKRKEQNRKKEHNRTKNQAPDPQNGRRDGNAGQSRSVSLETKQLLRRTGPVRTAGRSGQ